MFDERAKAIEGLTNYEILKNEDLTDVSSRGMLLRHKKSGAHVALVMNDDNNKTFSIGFRTPVEDSTGVPHIIEHSVLCGSDKYPVKDPFQELVKGSLNTFLNAMTYGDRTIYPVASCNDKDFKNLMGVYMDAVFHPLIYSRPEIFRQEGIRFDIGENGELLYNGVVYNEMKGAMSSPERVLYEKSLEGIFPDTTYGFNSGGEPEVIRTLTYEKFLAFHKRYYHPSNSYIALYGDFDAKERLEWMDENYLSQYDAIDPDSEIKKQDPTRSNRDIESVYPLGDKEDDKNKAYFAINFIVGDETTAVENAASGIILDTLIGKNGAPVWQAVMESGICEDFSCWMDTDLRQPIVSMEARNADPARREEFVEIIKDTLAKEIEKGLNKKTIMALINRREFEYLEADSASTPRGIVYLLDMYGKWIYNEDRGFETFKGTEVFAKLRRMIEDGSFDRLAKEKFLDTDNWAFVTLLPKKGLGEERDAELVKKLKEMKDNMSAAELEKIEADAKKLEEYRKTPDTKEALATIPGLKREDMTKTVLPISNKERSIAGVPVWQNDYSGNGIVYARLYFALTGIKEEEIAPVSLLTKILSQVDTEKFSYSELDDEINLVSGGISFAGENFTNADNVDEYRAYFRVKTKVKEDKLAEVAGLIPEILLRSKFDDKKHIYDMMNMIRSGLEYRLEAQGHLTGSLRGRATKKQQAYYDLKSSGIDFYKYVDGILNDFDNKYPALCKQLEELCGQIFTTGNLTVAVTATDETYGRFEKGFAKLFEELPKDGRFGKAAKMEEFTLPTGNEAFYTAGQVTYTSLVGETKNSLAKTGYAKVLTTILNNELLYPEIRIKGGAYGAFGNFFGVDDILVMSTYRDSKVRESVEVFKKTADFAENFEADEEQMTKYIIGTMSSDDTPLNARQRGERSFGFMMRKLPVERVQKWRDELLSTTAEDVRKFGPVLREIAESGTLTSVGNESILRENAALFDRITPLLREEKK